MFSEGVVSKKTKDNLVEQRANSKFNGIYSKRKGGQSDTGKSEKLQKVEEDLNGTDYFS